VLKQHRNRGHGPTIVRGYRESGADWILQIDADGEIPPQPFEKLWDARHEYDLLLLWRTVRAVPRHRRVLSLSARLMLRVLFRAGVSDVNCPYRLYRRRAFSNLISLVKDEDAIPNAALTGLSGASAKLMC
jgi:glycosyltransferase involved in cell wall biosynthesis